MTTTDYAAEQRAKLDAKVRELRAEGWDVLPRSERDLALSKRDDALDEIDCLREAAEEAIRLLEESPGWSPRKSPPQLLEARTTLRAALNAR